jgi:signal transduction histidine kinase
LTRPVKIFIHCCLLSMLVMVVCPAWATSKADSLLRVLGGQPDDSAKVLTLNELFKVYLYSDPGLAKRYAKRAYDLSKNLRWENGVAKMANNLGVYHSQQGQFDQSIAYYNEVLGIYTRRKDSVAMANIFRNVGGVYFRQSDFLRSTQYYEQALGLYQAQKDTAGIVGTVGNLATIKKEQGDYPEAQRAFLYVLHMQEVMGDYREVARIAMNIAGIYQLQGDKANARQWYARGHQVADSIQDLYLISSALNGLSELAIEDGKYPEAQQLADSARASSLAVGDDYMHAYALINLGRVADHNGNTALAEELLQEALAICVEIGRGAGEVIALQYLGATQLKAGKTKVAIGNLEAALAQTYEIGLPLHRRKVLYDLSRAYAGTRDFERAYRTQSDYLALHDSIFSAEKSAQVTEVQAKFKSEEQQRIIQQLNLEHAQDQLRIIRSRQGTYVLFAGIFLFLSTAIFLFLRARQNKSQSLQIAIKNKEIAAQRDFAELQALRILQINSNLEQLVATRTAAVVEAKRELDIFLYESAHALRRPLTRISALVELVNQERDPQQATQLRHNLALTLQNMDDLLHKLIMVNESSRRDPLRTPVDLGKLLQACLSELNLSAKAEVVNRVPTGTMVIADSYLLHSVLVSLLENAVSFHPDSAAHRASVELSWEPQGNSGTLKVYDNGSGVPPDQAEKIFDMFYRGTVKGSGQGLGLYIARKSAERIGAQVKWMPGTSGATFVLQLQ